MVIFLMHFFYILRWHSVNLLFFLLLIVCLVLTALGLHCFAQALFSCGKWGYSLVAVCGFSLPWLLLLLLLLSRFSRVRLCATPEMAAHQAPLSLGFSGKNTGVGCHFLLQCVKVKSESEVAQFVYLKVIQSCLTPRDPMDCSLPGSSVHGIFQARVLEWGAIALFLLGGHKL